MLEKKSSVKPKIRSEPPSPSPKSENNILRRSGLLDGREAVRKFLGGVSDYKLNKWIKAGMPILIDEGRWLAHTENIEDFFKTYTRVDSRNKISIDGNDQI